MKISKKAILFTVSVLVGNVAHADFAGSWQGQGKMFDSAGYRSDCDDIGFDVVQSATELRISKGHIICKDLSSTWTPFVLIIQGNALWSNGKKVGSINGDSFSATFTEPNSPMIETYKVSIVNSILNFEETMTDQSTGYLTVQASLMK